MTRRANGEGHFKQTKNGFQIQLRVGPGKRIYKNGGKTRKEAKRRLEELKKEHHINLDTNVSFKEWLEIWLKRYAANRAESTAKQYESLIKNHINPYLGDVKLADLKPSHFSNLYEKLSSRLVGKSINTLHSLLNACINRAVKDEILFRNVLRVVDKPSINPPKHRILSEKEFHSFFQKALQSRYKFTLLLMMFGGLRKGEALGASWESFDFNKKSLRIRRQLTIVAGVIKLRPLKTQKSYRTIILSDSVFKELVTISAYKRKGLLYDQSLKNPRKFDSDFKKLANSIGIPELTPHDLRHTHASQLLNEGESLPAVSKRLGHSSVKTTGDIYAHLIPGSGSSAANKMETILTRGGIL